MKKLFFQCTPFFFIGVFLLFTACEKQEFIADTKLEKEKIPSYDEFMSTIQMEDRKEYSLENLNIENNYLVFDDIEHFKDAIHKIGYVDEEKLENWGKANGFTSLRSLHMQAEIESALVDSKEKLESFNKKWQGKIHIDSQEKTISDLLQDYPFSSLANQDGVLKIGNDLYVNTDKIRARIAGDNYSKVAIAKQMKEGNHSLGIELDYLEDMAESRHRRQRRQAESANRDRRLVVSIDRHPNTPYGLNFVRLLVSIKSTRDGWFGRQVAHRTNITFSYGATVRASCANESFTNTSGGGAGWSQRAKNISYQPQFPFRRCPRNAVYETTADLFDRIGGTFGTDEGICLCFYCPVNGSCFDQCAVEGRRCN